MVVEEDGHLLYHRSKDSHGSYIAEQKLVTETGCDRRGSYMAEQKLVTERGSDCYVSCIAEEQNFVKICFHAIKDLTREGSAAKCELGFSVLHHHRPKQQELESQNWSGFVTKSCSNQSINQSSKQGKPSKQNTHHQIYFTRN
jgi:hypothetical protein